MIHEVRGDGPFVYGFVFRLAKPLSRVIGNIIVENRISLATKSAISENLHMPLWIALELFKKRMAFALR